MVDTNSRRRRWWLLPTAAALAGAAVMHFSAPDYLLHRGFPLDDAWIHAVYARELARSGTLAYNPGVPATGETSPLWAFVLAAVHLIAPASRVVVLTKISGFCLHVASAVLLGRALARLTPSSEWLAWSGAALVAAHPDLIAASVSGMEVPLATLVFAGAVAAISGRAATMAMFGAAALAARPETPVLVVAFTLLYFASSNPRRALITSGAALAGAGSMLAIMALRNWKVSGLPLPATFYVKANAGSLMNPALQQLGFVEMLGRMPLVNVPFILVLGAIFSAFLLRRAEGGHDARAAAALYASGLTFCFVSFALVPPADPPAFYHQRYVLPALAPLIVGLPLLLHAALVHVVPRQAGRIVAAALAAIAVPLVIAMPERARHLANDAHNIDDVQVAFGQALAGAAPAATAWVVDAGASRFFGRPFVVDMIGLNTPELLRAGAQRFLDAHPPSYFDVFPGWSGLGGDAATRFPARSFETTTAYTVTGAASMRTHVLVSCTPPGYQGGFTVRGRQWTFRCGF